MRGEWGGRRRPTRVARSAEGHAGERESRGGHVAPGAHACVRVHACVRGYACPGGVRLPEYMPPPRPASPDIPALSPPQLTVRATRDGMPLRGTSLETLVVIVSAGTLGAGDEAVLQDQVRAATAVRPPACGFHRAPHTCREDPAWGVPQKCLGSSSVYSWRVSLRPSSLSLPSPSYWAPPPLDRRGSTATASVR